MRKKITLETGSREKPKIILTAYEYAGLEFLGYLWIGEEIGACVGVIPDKDVELLRDWCNQILADRAEDRP